MNKKIAVDFVTNNDPVVSDVANAQLIQLMTTITKIGLRVDNPNSSSIIVKENEHGSKKTK
jgi:hypothetical protein